MTASRIPLESTSEPIAGVRLRSFWRAATANTKVTIGLVIVLFFVLLALVGPFFVPSDVNAFGSDLSASPSAAGSTRRSSWLLSLQRPRPWRT